MGRTYQSILIQAPVDQVWQAVRDFHDLSWAPDVVESVEKVGELAGDRVGAVRVLNGAFRETLLEHDDEERVMVYSIDDGPSPVSADDVDDYIGRLHARPVTEGEGTFVEWSSSWRGNEEAATEFCHGIYVSLLNDMKRSLE